MAVTSRSPILIDHPYLQLALPGDWVQQPEPDGLFASYERADHSAFNIVLASAPPRPNPKDIVDRMMEAHAASLANNHPRQMDPQPPKYRSEHGVHEAMRQYLCRGDGVPWRVTARYATTLDAVSVGGLPLAHAVVQLTVYESPWTGPEMEQVLANAKIVPLLAPPPAPSRPTRWVWIPEPGGTWILAFTYSDPMAGPSAKGAAIANPVTAEQIRNAIDHPDRTFREPAAFGAIAIGPEEALRLGLPKDPPWIGVFEGKPIPPPRGEASRTVSVVVRRNGDLVRGARVQIGHLVGEARELIKLDERTTDATGRCDFPLAPTRAIGAVAVIDGASSKLVDVSATATSIALEILDAATLHGQVKKDGRGVPASISITGKDGGVHRVERSDAAGRYALDGIVPGTYEIVIHGIHPTTRMTAGTPARDELTLAPGQRVQRDYTLAGGRTIHIAAQVQSQDHSGDVYLFAGVVSPTSSLELRRLCTELPRDAWRSANSTSSDGRTMTTDLLDVAPGNYTLCVAPWNGRGLGHADQPVVCRAIVVGTVDVTVELAVPPLRPA